MFFYNPMIKRLALPIFILLLIIFNIATCKMVSKYKEQAEINLNNYNELERLMEEKDSAIAVQLTLKEDEFEKKYTKLADSLNIKASRIREITKIKIINHRDTIISWIDSTNGIDTVYLGRNIRFSDNCFKLTLFEPKDSNYVRIQSDINMDAYFIAHLGKRKNQAKLFGWTLFRYGRRTLETDAYLNCDKGKIRITNIKVIE